MMPNRPELGKWTIPGYEYIYVKTKPGHIYEVIDYLQKQHSTRRCCP